MAAIFKWGDRELTVLRSEYLYGSYKQLALLAFDEDDPECCIESGMPYGVITVNLDDPMCEPEGDSKYGVQYLDVNNWPGLSWILSHSDIDWAEQTESKMQSGFVTYPLWIFDLEKIQHV